MAQSTVFPVRYGLSLPPAENLKAVEVFSEGGLDLTQSIIENRPGCASSLINFEVSLTGGYRRINGFAKYSTTVVPGQGQLLGVAVLWPSTILAARQDASDATKYNLYRGTGTTWTRINPTATTDTADIHGVNSTHTVTITVATPGVVTWTGHGFSTVEPTPIVFTTTGALPTGITASVTYYVIPSTVTTNTFEIATSHANALASTPVNTSGSQSGTQTGTTAYNFALIENLTSTAALIPGQPVSGTGVATGSVISSIVNSTSIIVSINTTATTLGVTLTFSNPLNYTSGMVLNFCFYNWTGTVRCAITDGVNYAYRWDGTSMVILNDSNGAAANPSFACEFFGYLVVGGYTSNSGAIKWCAPLEDTDWNPTDGAAEVVVGNTVTWLASWRQQLIIFSTNSISKMVQNTLNTTGTAPPPPFQIQPVTDKIGCLIGRTVKEIDGDLLFLAPDGFRTISGTFNIGDTEIGSVSRPIQSIISAINTNTNPCHAMVVHKKTQYRLFYPNYANAPSTCMGIIGSIRRFRDSHEGWEWGQLQGIQPSCCASGYLSDGNEYVIHGGLDGYVYRQEQGNSFNGTAISEVYTTVPLELGDIGLRKAIQRITLYVTSNASTTLYLKLIYNYNNPGTINPPQYEIKDIGGTSTLYNSGALYNSGVVYGVSGVVAFRKTVQGSGFTVELQLNSESNINTPPYVIQGYYIEYFPAGRR